LKNQLPDTDKLTGSRLTKGYSIQVAMDSQTKEMCFDRPGFVGKVGGGCFNF